MIKKGSKNNYCNNNINKKFNLWINVNQIVNKKQFSN